MTKGKLTCKYLRKLLNLTLSVLISRLSLSHLLFKIKEGYKKYLLTLNRIEALFLQIDFMQVSNFYEKYEPLLSCDKMAAATRLGYKAYR